MFCGPGTAAYHNQRGEALVAERSPTPPRTGFDSPRPCERVRPKCLYGLGSTRPNSTLKTEEIANKGIGARHAHGRMAPPVRGSSSWDGTRPYPGRFRAPQVRLLPRGHREPASRRLRDPRGPVGGGSHAGVAELGRRTGLRSRRTKVRESSILSARTLAGAR